MSATRQVEGKRDDGLSTSGSSAATDRKSGASAADEQVVADFNRYLSDDPDSAIAVAAIRALTEAVKRCRAKTMSELLVELKAAADCLVAVVRSARAHGQCRFSSANTDVADGRVLVSCAETVIDIAVVRL
jgi:hypothetical protein